MRIGFCISGGGRIAEAAFHARASGLLKLRGACVLVDRPTPFAAIAERFNIPIQSVQKRPEESRDAFRTRLGESINALPVDALFMTFNWILPVSTFDRYGTNVVNLHMGILPFFPGFGAVRASLRSGMRFSGITIHRADIGMDTGPAIIQATTPIIAGMTEAQLGGALFKAAIPAAIQALRWMECGRLGQASDNRVEVEGAGFDGGPTYPRLDQDVIDFSSSYIAKYYPD